MRDDDLLIPALMLGFAIGVTFAVVVIALVIL